MQDQLNNIERTLGRIEEGQEYIKSTLKKHDEDIRGLLKFKYWLIGLFMPASASVGAIVSQVKDTLAGTPHH